MNPVVLAAAFVVAFGAARPASGGAPGLEEQRPGVFRHVVREKTLMESVRGLWQRKKAGTPEPLAKLEQRFSVPATSSSVEAQRVLRGHQEVAGARIAGTWLKALKSDDGRTLFATGASLENPPVHLESEVRRMERSRSAALARVRRDTPELLRAAEAWEPRIEIHVDPKSRSYRPIWVIDFIDESETGAWTLKADETGTVLALGRSGTGLVDGQALVFPEGPKSSSLTQVVLPRLTGDGSLTSDRFRVYSALDPQAWAPDLVFRYGTADVRFDEVQTYFFVERAVGWFQSRFGTQLAQPIEVKTHVGPDGQSNAAFYFKGRVFLGTGDGTSYKDLMRDPSVVIHETVHAFIDEIAGLPSQGDGGSLNEGFADFFTASITGNPKIGEASYLKGPYRRTLLNELKAYRDFADGVYVNGSIVAATLWDIRKALGDAKATRLAITALARLGEGSRLDDFTEAVVLAAEAVLSREERKTVSEALAARGWRVEPIRR